MRTPAPSAVQAACSPAALSSVPSANTAPPGPRKTRTASLRCSRRMRSTSNAPSTATAPSATSRYASTGSAQICGKQTSIRFRHVERDLVIDSTRPVAVVKWLAEFDNFREKRADKAEKLVRFCQVARLEFRGEQICYLEEYGQSVSGPGARWPPLGMLKTKARATHPQALQGVRRRGDVRQVPDALRLALEALRAPAGDAVRRGPVRESNFTAPSC